MNTQGLITNAQAGIADQEETLRLESIRLGIISAKANSFIEDRFAAALEKVGVKEIRRTVQFQEVNSSFGQRCTEEELRNAYLVLDLRVSSTKIKPILFAGYTKEGRGKNTEHLIAKAKKLQELFTKHTGYKCSINYFGMEVKSQADEFTFSVVFYI